MGGRHAHSKGGKEGLAQYGDPMLGAETATSSNRSNNQ